MTRKTVDALSLASVGLASLVGWSPSLAQAVPPVFLSQRKTYPGLSVQRQHGVKPARARRTSLVGKAWHTTIARL